jgi:methylthioribose-1-phosphate isomerase
MRNKTLLQGARLTAWELKREGIPATLISDNMAGALMKNGGIDMVIVGADRIARNGDAANKIGTYTIAVLASENRIPFYIAAPISTIDLSLKSGKEIPIEQRDPKEVTQIGGRPIAPRNTNVYNPAFDVTPHTYIRAIITDRGVSMPPFEQTLKSLVESIKK